LKCSDYTVGEPQHLSNASASLQKEESFDC
jgi:hypothetical protein